MKLELIVPTTLNEIPLDHYQKFMAVSESNTDDNFIAEKMIQYFCGIELKDVVHIKATDLFSMVEHFNKLFTKEPKFIPTFKINGVEFGFIPNLEEISLGEYADIDGYLNDISKLHNLMAVLYRPITKKNKGNQYLIEEYKGSITYADVMKYAPLDVCLGAKVFFYNLKNELLNALSLYLSKQEKKVLTLARKHNLPNNGDGIRQSIDLLRGTLEGLTKSLDWNYSSALPSLCLKHN